MAVVMPEEMNDEGKTVIRAYGGAPDAFVAGRGTGGTLTGVGQALPSEDEERAVLCTR